MVVLLSRKLISVQNQLHLNYFSFPVVKDFGVLQLLPVLMHDPRKVFKFTELLGDFQRVLEGTNPTPSFITCLFRTRSFPLPQHEKKVYQDIADFFYCRVHSFT